MSPLLLIVEPDAAGRKLMERVLRAEGMTTLAVSSLDEAAEELSASRVSLALVDEAAGAGASMVEVHRLVEAFPRVPIIATGTLLNERVLVELLRLGVDDVLRKPFTPDDLRASVHRVLAREAPDHEGSLEYAAAIAQARNALASGAMDSADRALARARAIHAFDAESMLLSAQLAELRGQLDDAARGFRAALALSTGSDVPASDAYDGLTRVSARERETKS